MGYTPIDMPKYRLKVDSRHRITLPDPVAQSIGDEIDLSPNTVTALISRKDISLKDKIKSTRLLLAMLNHEEEIQRTNPAALLREAF